jgi:hypothetical protein
MRPKRHPQVSSTGMFLPKEIFHDDIDVTRREVERTDEVSDDVYDYLRLSTIHDTGAILILEDDKIIEHGKREILIVQEREVR